MASFSRHSLLQRMGLLMAIITMMAVSSMGVSLFIAERLEGQATAINQAGALRMQSYRLLARALTLYDGDAETWRQDLRSAQREFEQRLSSPELAAVLLGRSAGSVGDQFIQLKESWRQHIRPQLAEYARQPPPDGSGDTRSRQRLITKIDAFVPRIDMLVGLIEQGVESKIRRLRAIQAVSLFLTLGVVLLTMYFMQTGVVIPLNDLLGCARRFRRGDFSRRAVHVGGDEFGRLGQSFNVMATDLSKLYAGLEARVAERTAELHRSNRALELLHHTSTRLGADPLSRSTYRELLEEMKEVMGIEAGLVCLAVPGREEGQIQAFSLPGDVTPSACTGPDCGTCLGGDGPPLSPGQLRSARSSGLLTIPLGEPGAREGVMTLSLGAGRDFTPWQRQLGEAVGRSMSMALANARRGEEARRMALLEERTAMARELHDSLAQSLSYLKIQVTRIEVAMGEQGDAVQARAIVKELRRGLNSAYQQLRELLTTFRIQIDGRGLVQALEDTVAEFQTRTETGIVLNNELYGRTLGPNEEVHILQIVREGLTNVVRHARAQRATVTLRDRDNGDVEVVVEDDGIGMTLPVGRRHHYGLSIMRERADSLCGQLDFDSGSQHGGTRVTLQFTPASACAAANNVTESSA